jgi:cyclopropane-fatty-acyl-phospholipid synthase
MSYSSGLFSTNGQTLEEAQESKLDRVFELLDLSGGEQVLEIGCGWGGLAERLIERHRCKVTGLTLSGRQWSCPRRLETATCRTATCGCRTIETCQDRSRCFG